MKNFANVIDSNRSLFVSAGLLAPKKRDNSIVRNYRYLNYGLLGLATRVNRDGHGALMAHGNYADPVTFAESLAHRGLLSNSRPLMLSLPSCFAITWAQEFTKQLKSINPGGKIVVGGRWVISDDPAWLAERLPNADLLVCGTAESRIIDLLDVNKWEGMPGTGVSESAGVYTAKDMPERLDFSLMDQWHEFHPSIEVSRGCGKGCAFCVESKAALTRLKEPGLLLEEISDALRLYNGIPAKIYFEASLFSPHLDWCKNFVELYKAKNMSFEWRCESRVDTITPEKIELLSKAGLRVIDFGLESASPMQLKRMSKSDNPVSYLQKAAELFKACYDNEVMVKVNVLMYAGETMDTIAQTSDWLHTIRHNITGVSVSPLMAYRNGSHTEGYIKSLQQHGAELQNREQLESFGWSKVHLSGEIDADHADELAFELSRQIMDSRDFYDLKSFCYFPPNFTYSDFIAMTNGIDPSTLSFSLEQPSGSNFLDSGTES